jgi:hypothetical protein
MDTYESTTKMTAAMPTVNVTETTTPRKRVVDLDAIPPAREDGPRPIPRRFVGRTYDALRSQGCFDPGFSAQQAAEAYGVTKIHLTRDMIGLAGEFWKNGDTIENIPVNVACELVGWKVANFDRSEFKDEQEVEALEKRGYRIDPPRLKAIEKPEFASVLAAKKGKSLNGGKWMSGALESSPGSS